MAVPPAYNSALWALSTKGNVYRLSTKKHNWEHVHNEGQLLRGFKRITTSNEGAWGLGCDHQVYVFIEASDVPIRCVVTTYENERWVPSRGWSSRNLISGVDPPQWSSSDGNVYLCKDSFKLSSDNWVWESDWCVDENVKGFLTEKGGWRYSTVDFRGQFSHQKTFKSCVRRRKWIRHYKYISTDVWARIPSLHMNPLEEPIVDLAAGGQSIPNQPSGFLAVWGVTIDGRVLYRIGVSTQCPEGVSWVDVSVEEGNEILSVSVGPTDMMWAVTWSGSLLVREGSSWQNPKGTGWIELDAPDPYDKLVHVAVGNFAVWVTSVSGNVWQRKCVKSEDLKKATDKTYWTGTGWLHMVNKMKMIVVGPNDHVWGIDYNDRQIHYRKGISPEEPSGRTWAVMNVPHCSQSITISSSSQSVRSNSSSFSSFSSSPRTATDSLKEDSPQTRPSPETAAQNLFFHEKFNYDSCGHSASSSQNSTDVERTGPSKSNGHVVVNDEASIAQSDTCPVENADVSQTENSLLENDRSTKINLHPTVSKRNTPAKLLVDHIQNKAVRKSKKVVKFFREKINKDFFRDESDDEDDEKIMVKFSASDSSLRLNCQADADTVSEDSRISRGSSESDLQLFQQENLSSLPTLPVLVNVQGDSDNDSTTFCDSSDSFLETEPDLDDIYWLWISANQCVVQDDSHIKHWFNRATMVRSASMSGEYQRQLSQAAWRHHILDLLHERSEREQMPFNKYSLAIEKSCWVKKGQLRWWRDTEKKPKWVPVEVELIQDSDTQEKDGTFTIQYHVKKQPKHMTFSLRDVSAVYIISDPSHSAVFALQLITRLKMIPRLQPLRFAPSGEEELEDWVAALSVACCDHRRVGGAPGYFSAWSLTSRGDIFVHDPERGLTTEFCPEMFWHQYGGHLKVVETCPLGVTWGIGYSGTPYIYTGGYGGSFFKGMATSPHGIKTQTDTREMCVYENQRWRPISGYTNRVLFTDCYNWSDVSGKVECTKEGTKLPSKHWTWSTDWMVDRKLPSGVDKDGWQYSRKLNRTFYSHPKLHSVFRRRKWIRRCSIVTSGPWQEVTSQPLKDISFEVNPNGNTAAKPLSLWAVNVTGEVLYRHSVTANCPMGTVWSHVPSDVQYTSISVGGNGCVWATATDGSAWLRHGVSASNPIGDCWFHVSPPEGCELTQVSAGFTNVWAVDNNKDLWCRKGVTSTHDEGDIWVKVARNVKHVSCGPRDQVWVVLNQVTTSEGKVDGVLARRAGLALDRITHGSWDKGIGSGWKYVTVRGWMK